MTERLTDAQRDVVDKNLAMVNFMVRKYRPPAGMDADDWLQECMIQMARAVIWHDPAKGQLSTIFDRMVFNRRTHLHRYANRGRRGKVYLESSGPEEQSLLQLYAAEHPWERIDAIGLIRQALTVCSEYEVEVFRMLADGWSQKEISVEFGVSRQRITEVMSTAREKVAKAFPDLVICSKDCARCGGPAQVFACAKKLYCAACSKILRTGRKLRNEKQRKQRLKAAGA